MPEDRFAILADLCAVTVWNGGAEPLFGCRSTPPFDGPDEGLVPTPATAQLLKAWGGESPDFWWNAAP